MKTRLDGGDGRARDEGGGRFDVTLYLSYRHNLYHFSKTLVGLLGQGGLTRVRFAPPRAADAEVDPQALEIDVSDPADGRVHRACIELWDSGERFANDALDRCDVYFKRSYHPLHVAALAEDRRRKVRPFGANFACVDGRVRRMVKARFALSFAARALRNPIGAARWLRGEADQLKQFLASPDLLEFEHDPDAPCEPAVLLQTRVWEPGGDDPEHDERINEERTALVRRLKPEFGPRFWGGLIPTPYALRRYPDLVTDRPARRADYVATISSCLIGVYCRGIHDSIAFKFSEYLAASRCLVSEPLVHVLPTPPAEGENLLTFREPDSCAEACKRILSDPDLQTRMRHANRRYYATHVEPVAHMRSILSRVVDGDVAPATASVAHPD